jgi:undecaprenyl-diphosphatase
MEEWGPELALLLGLIEGLTEFLPVSSTGHLILVGHFLGFTGEMASTVEISIQLGAVLAVVAYERVKIVTFLRNAAKEARLFRRTVRARRSDPWQSVITRSALAHRHLWFLIGLAIAFFPAALFGLIAHKWIETHLFTPQTVAAALIAGGLIILLVERRARAVRVEQLDHVGVRHAFLVGLAQCASLFPGVSRSGATIVGGLLVGMDRKVATEYSFFLALPTMLAATGYKIIKSHELFTLHDAAALTLGLVVAFIVAWGVISVFLTYVKRHRLSIFAYYRILLGIVVLLVVH